MPVHHRKIGAGKEKNKYVVVDDAGKKYGTHAKKEDAVAQVAAINISAGHVPGVKPKKKK